MMERKRRSGWYRSYVPYWKSFQSVNRFATICGEERVKRGQMDFTRGGRFGMIFFCEELDVERVMS